MIVVSNSTPIISLATVGNIPLLGALFGRVIIPREVEHELKSTRSRILRSPYHSFEGFPMYYSQLTYRIKKKDERRRAVGNLIRLRAQLDRSVPNKDTDDNLLLATFNIRDLGKNNRRGWGKRLPESLSLYL